VKGHVLSVFGYLVLLSL